MSYVFYFFLLPFLRWKSYLVSNFKKASENVLMIEFESLWEGRRLTDGQCER